MSMPTSGLGFFQPQRQGNGKVLGQSAAQPQGMGFFGGPDNAAGAAGPSVGGSGPQQHYQVKDDGLNILPSQRMQMQGNVSPMQLRAQLVAEAKQRQKQEEGLNFGQGGKEQ